MTKAALITHVRGSPVVPALFAPDQDSVRRFVEFFTANIRNPNTRRAYLHAAMKFASWCEANGLTDLPDIEPVHVAAYIEMLQTRLAAPSESNISRRFGCFSTGLSSARLSQRIQRAQFVVRGIPSRRARRPY
jgi:hypothetical protein